MTKNQKMLLGVGALAVAGYLIYQQMNKKNMVGFVSPGMPNCPECFKGKCIERRTITGALSSTGVVVKCSTTPSIPTTPPPTTPIPKMIAFA